jgi:Rrf2 family transcriptional regulator, cysteine metabolism repressor
VNISARIRNAVRLMICLAVHYPGTHLSLRKISEFTSVSVKYLEQIIPELREAGIISSVQGKMGGYRLGREPDDISLFDIYSSYSRSVLLSGIDDEGAALDSIAWNKLDGLVKAEMEKTSLGSMKKSFLDTRGFMNYVI